jgi:hypothetical protein
MGRDFLEKGQDGGELCALAGVEMVSQDLVDAGDDGGVARFQGAESGVGDGHHDPAAVLRVLRPLDESERVHAGQRGGDGRAGHPLVTRQGTGRRGPRAGEAVEHAEFQERQALAAVDEHAPEPARESAGGQPEIPGQITHVGGGVRHKANLG